LRREATAHYRRLRQRELAKIAEVKGTVETDRLRIELRTLADLKKVELEKQNRQIQKLDQENEQLRRSPVRKTIIVVDIQPTVVPNPDGKGFIVLGVVELTNQGNLDTRIAWHKQPPAMQMSRALFRADGQPDFDHQTKARVRSTSNPNADAHAHIVRGGGKEAVVFALHAPVAGLYLLSFRAEGEPLEPEQAASGGAGEPLEPEQTASGGAGLPRPWTGNKYVLVGEALVPSAAAAAP